MCEYWCNTEQLLSVLSNLWFKSSLIKRGHQGHYALRFRPIPPCSGFYYFLHFFPNTKFTVIPADMELQVRLQCRMLRHHFFWDFHCYARYCAITANRLPSRVIVFVQTAHSFNLLHLLKQDFTASIWSFVIAPFQQSPQFVWHQNAPGETCCTVFVFYPDIWLEYCLLLS